MKDEKERWTCLCSCNTKYTVKRKMGPNGFTIFGNMVVLIDAALSVMTTDPAFDRNLHWLKAILHATILCLY
jgi:hypothetical protein